MKILLYVLLLTTTLRNASVSSLNYVLDYAGIQANFLGALKKRLIGQNCNVNQIEIRTTWHDSNFLGAMKSQLIGLISPTIAFSLFAPTLQAQTLIDTLSVHYARALAVNPVTNKIYVTNNLGDNVSIINGLNDGVVTVPVGSHPTAIGINLKTNKISVEIIAATLSLPSTAAIIALKRYHLFTRERLAQYLLNHQGRTFNSAVYGAIFIIICRK